MGVVPDITLGDKQWLREVQVHQDIFRRKLGEPEIELMFLLFFITELFELDQEVFLGDLSNIRKGHNVLVVPDFHLA